MCQSHRQWTIAEIPMTTTHRHRHTPFVQIADLYFGPSFIVLNIARPANSLSDLWSRVVLYIDTYYSSLSLLGGFCLWDSICVVLFSSINTLRKLLCSDYDDDHDYVVRRTVTASSINIKWLNICTNFITRLKHLNLVGRTVQMNNSNFRFLYEWDREMWKNSHLESKHLSKEITVAWRSPI